MWIEIKDDLSLLDSSWMDLVDKYILMLNTKIENDTENIDYAKLKAMLIDYKMLLQHKQI